MKTADGKDMNVPSKTPEEIKKGLEVCAIARGPCECCPYKHDNSFECIPHKSSDSLAYIKQLERERDAAVEELKGYGCTYCKRLEDPDESMCGEKCDDFCNWEWRGVEEE